MIFPLKVLVLFLSFMIGPILKAQADTAYYPAFVDQLPIWPGCEDGTAEEIKICSDRKLVDFVFGAVEFAPHTRDFSFCSTLLLELKINHIGEIIDVQLPSGHPGDLINSSIQEAFNCLIEDGFCFIAAKKAGNAVGFHLRISMRIHWQ